MIQVKRDGDRDLEFQGELLAHASTRKESDCRWTEISLYRRDSNQDKYIVHVVGRTEVKDEYDRHRADICDTLDEVYQALLMPSPGGYKYLSWVAKEVLEAAAKVEPAFESLLKERL